MRAFPLAAAALALAACACGLMPPDAQTPPGGTPPPPPPVNAPPPPLANYHLVWADEFDAPALDTTRWTVFTGVRRDAVNTADAVKLADGLLTVTTTTVNGVHQTGFLGTDGKFLQQYGYYEARIRFNTSPGTWCAFWLLAPNNGKPVGDPAHAGVEIDVVEHRVTDQGGAHLADAVANALNWDGYGPDLKNKSLTSTLPSKAPVQGQWHTYGVLWSTAGYTYYVDGTPIMQFADPVSQTPEAVELSCEVEDRSWAGNVPAGGYGSAATSTTRMDVDWVRVWQEGT
jgi:beta-glucanase (GH16 family)